MTMECYDEDSRYGGQEGAGCANGCRMRRRYPWDEIERQLRVYEARERATRRALVAAAGVAMAAAAWTIWRLA